MRRVLVTGADGMLGSHVVRDLLSRGVEVRALIQPNRATGTLDGLPVDTVEGDLLDRKQLAAAVAGCEGVINVAGNTQVWPARSSAIWQVNYHAVQVIAELVLREPEAVLVHVGSANSFASGSKEHPGVEGGPYIDGRYGLDYQDSKRAAQDYLLSMHIERGLRVRIINPGFMFGAYDSKPGSGQVVIATYRETLPGVSAGGRSFVAARDVATAVCNALERGRDGECYLATGVNLSSREIVDLIAEVVGSRPPRLTVPAWALISVGLFGSFWGLVSGRRPQLSLPMVRVANHSYFYSNRKAVEELDMPQSDLREAIRECFDWFREHRYV